MWKKMAGIGVLLFAFVSYAGTNDAEQVALTRVHLTAEASPTMGHTRVGLLHDHSAKNPSNEDAVRSYNFLDRSTMDLQFQNSQLVGGGNTPPGGGNSGGNTPPGGGNSIGNTPPGGINTPPGGINTPPGGINTPPGGINTPPGGINTPPGNINTPPSGVNTPPGGINPPGGANPPTNSSR